MKAYAFGFQFRTFPAIPPRDFVQFLINRDVDEFDYARLRRVLVVTKIGSRIGGMLVTSREHRNQTILQSDADGNRTVRVRSPGENIDPADLNFFLFNPKAHPNQPAARGIYVAYRGSCSTRMFGKILGNRFNINSSEQKQLASEHEESECEGPLSSEKRKQLSERFPRGKFRFDQLVDRRTFDDRLKELKRISAFDYHVPVIEDATYQSGSHFVDTEKRTISIKMRSRENPRLFEWLRGFIGRQNIDHGTVRGADSNNQDRDIRLDQDILSFASFLHDDVVASENVRINTFHQAPIFRTLGGLMDQTPATFGESLPNP